jgi:hypothetical protein
MKIVFCDFDGVLNSAASFLLEDRIRQENTIFDDLPPVNQTLCKVCTSNFRYILDEVPDAKIVISSSWRNLFELDWLKDKLTEYGIPGSKVIDKTPGIPFAERGVEIDTWLEAHPEVTNYVILDDNYIGPPFQPNPYEEGPNFVKSTWNVGLTLPLAVKAVTILGGKDKGWKLGLE